MCEGTEICLRKFVDGSVVGDLSRLEQAKSLGLSRSVLLGAFAGKLSETTLIALSVGLNAEIDAVQAASKVAPCGIRRPLCERSAYGIHVEGVARTAGLTLDGLRQRSGVDRTSFFHALGVGHRPGPAHLLAIANVLEVDVIELARIAGERTEHPLDMVRIRTGMSRSSYAKQQGVTVALLFGVRTAKSPALAWRVARAQGADDSSALAEATSRRGEIAGNELGALIVGHLDGSGTSASTFSIRVGVSRQAVGSWIAGISSPVNGQIEALASALGLESGAVRASIENDLRAVSMRRASYGKLLRRSRLKQNLSRRDLATRLGVSAVHLYRAESGHATKETIEELTTRTDAMVVTTDG